MALGVAVILSEEWLHRRTGQTWWAISRLGSAAVFGTLAAALVVVGQPLVGLLAAGAALVEIALARRSWKPRGGRDMLQRPRPETTHGTGAGAGRPASRLGLRSWAFIIATGGVWSLLEYHWGLP